MHIIVSFSTLVTYSSQILAEVGALPGRTEVDDIVQKWRTLGMRPDRGYVWYGARPGRSSLGILEDAVVFSPQAADFSDKLAMK